MKKQERGSKFTLRIGARDDRQVRQRLLRATMIAAGYAVIMGLVGGLYFKSRAIDAMHKADCRVDCVAFGGLSDQPVKIPSSIAWAYRLCMAGAWGGGMIIVALLAYKPGR